MHITTGLHFPLRAERKDRTLHKYIPYLEENKDKEDSYYFVSSIIKSKRGILIVPLPPKTTKVLEVFPEVFIFLYKTSQV